MTGEFSLTQDLPDALPYWPADFNLNVTYRLYRDRLRVDAAVENLGPGRSRSAWGIILTSDCPVYRPDIGGHVLRANVKRGLGSRRTTCRPGSPADSRRARLPQPRPIGATRLDHVFTGRSALKPIRDVT